MENDPELSKSGKYLGKISQDFVKVADIIKEASYQLRVRKISEFPIFPISRVEISVGQQIIPKEKMETVFDYSISFLEEFIDRQLVDDENQENFVENYKNPDEYACLFLVEPEFTNFLYIPFPDDQSIIDE